MNLISEKIDVPAIGDAISRPRLLDTLGESLTHCSSTLISGRTGTGKTTLAADFARRCGRPVAWYEVDSSDADPGVFLGYLAATVARHRPGFESSLSSLADACAGDDMQTIASLTVYGFLEHGGEPLLVVLDDLHLIYDAPWVAPFLSRVLLLLPDDVHLMAIGRGLPPAPIWRMRSKQTLCFVDEAQLAFTPAEARLLFERHGRDPESAGGAVEATRGRAAALAAAARGGASSGWGVHDGGSLRA